MPIYEYQCQECNQVFEEWQKNFEEKEVACPVCGTMSKRIISNTSFILKGSGWYVTDYAAKNPSAAGGNGNGNGSGAASESAPAESATATKDAAKAESKSESKAVTKSEPKAAAKKDAPAKTASAS